MRTLIFLVIAASSAAAHAQSADQPAAPVPPPTPEAKPWTIGIEPRLGAIIPTSKLAANIVAGLELDWLTPALGHKLVIAIDASYARPSFTGTTMSAALPAPGTIGYTIDQTEVVVGLTAGYRFFDASHAFVPHVAVGPILHLLRSDEKTSPAYAGSNNSQQTQAGFEASVGADYKAGPGYLAGDLRFLYSSLSTPLTGSTNAGSVAVAVGYRFTF
jgi:hypothetical protein